MEKTSLREISLLDSAFRELLIINFISLKLFLQEIAGMRTENKVRLRTVCNGGQAYPTFLPHQKLMKLAQGFFIR